MYIQANIGRNSENVPMSDTAWANFQQDVKEEIMMSLMAAGLGGGHGANFQVHTGMGEWDGVKEESAHVSVYFEGDRNLMLGVEMALAAKLFYLAFQYGQDAIAFVVTDSHLATR